MVFRTIDGHLTTIFSKIKNINSGFDLTSNVIGDIVDRFNDFNTNQNFGKDWNSFIDGVKNENENVANLFKEIAKQGASAKASVEDVYAVILENNTRGYNNVKSIITAFNSLNPDNQKAFASAVGQSNQNLGNYLSNIKDGTASMRGYAGQIIKATAQTIGLKLATIALSAAITAVVSLAVTVVNKMINQMKDLKEEIDNLKSEFDDTKSKIEDINSTLDENKKKIEEINQNPLEITNKETLATLQLENAELERQKKLLEEISKQQAKELSDKTQAYLNKKSEVNMDNYWGSVWNNIVNKITPSAFSGESFVDDFKKIFDKNTTWLEKAGTALKYNPIFSTVANFADILTPETRSVLEETESFKNELQKNVDEIENILGNGQNIDYKAFSGLMSDVDELRSKLSSNIDTLLEYRDSLSTTSKEYQAIIGYIEDYTAQLAKLEEFDGYNLSGFTDNYFKIKDKFDKGLNGYLTSIADNQDIDKSISELLGTKFDESGKQFYALTGNYMEQYKQAEKLLNAIDNIELGRDLTYDESIIKSSVQNLYDTLSREIDKYGEDFLNGKSSEAANIFKNYIDSYPIEDITKETYNQWRDGLLQQAQGDTAIEDVLNRMVNAISLDISNIIENKPFETTTQSLTELKTAIDSAFGNQSTIQSAFDKIHEGTSLSADDVRKLVELCPKLSAEFIKTADGYTISADKLIKANESIVESTKQSLQKRADYLKQFINTDYDTSSINGSYEAKKYDEWKQSIASAKTELEGLELVLSMFGLTLEDTDDKIADLTKETSNLVSKAKTLSSAFAEQKENGKLSADTVLSLIENGYSAALMYDKTTGAIKLNTQAYLDLAKAEIQEKRTEIEIAKNDTLQSKLDAERAIVSNLGWEYLETSKAAIEFAKSKELINNANADLSNYDAQIAALNDLENSLGLVTEGLYGNNSKSKPQSILDFEAEYARRQHEINMGRMKEDEDYYKWLESAAKTAYEGLEDYQDDLWKYEEEVYKGRKQLAEDFYDSQRDYYKDRVSDLEAQLEITTKDGTDNNGNLLDAEEKFAYIRSVYSDILATIQEDINDIVQNGIEGHEDDLKALEQQYEKYVKEMADVFKDEVESEIDYIQDLQDTAEKAYDDKIDKIEAEKKAMEDRYDAEIDKIDSVIDSIESKNKSEKLTNDLIKARQDLEKANRNKRLVFDSSGNQKYVADTKAVSEAQQAVKEAEQAITVNKLEEVKKAIEDEKDVLSKSYDKQIQKLEERKQQEKDFYDNLVKTLQDYLNPNKQTESNTNVWNTVAGENGVVKVGDTEMSTSQVNARISSDDAVKNIYEQMLRNSAWSDTDIDKALKDYDITKLLTTLASNNYKALGVNEALTGNNVTNAQSYVNNNRNVTFNVTNDISISGNETDGRKIANEIIQEMTRQLPNAFTQQMYRNN